MERCIYVPSIIHVYTVMIGSFVHLLYDVGRQLLIKECELILLCTSSTVRESPYRFMCVCIYVVQI